MSDFLFARPSIVEGIGRNIDLFAAMQKYNLSENPAEADRRALPADIQALRHDMDRAKSCLIPPKDEQRAKTWGSSVKK